MRVCKRVHVCVRMSVFQERYTGAKQGRVGTPQAARTREERTEAKSTGETARLTLVALPW